MDTHEALTVDEDGRISGTSTFVYDDYLRPCIDLQKPTVLHIKAVAVHPGAKHSAVVKADFVCDQVAEPHIELDLETGLLTVTCNTDGASVFYTLDGSVPTPGRQETKLYQSHEQHIIKLIPAQVTPFKIGYNYGA